MSVRIINKLKKLGIALSVYPWEPGDEKRRLYFLFVAICRGQWHILLP